MQARTKQALFAAAALALFLSALFGGRAWGQSHDCVEVAADCSQEIKAVMDGLPDCVLDPGSLTCPPCPSPCPPPCEVTIDPVQPADYRFTIDFGAGLEGEMASLGTTWNRPGKRVKPYLAIVWIDTERELGVRAGNGIIHARDGWSRFVLAQGVTSNGEHDQRAMVGVRVGVGRRD
jgi:hypothetical protein